jgi:CRP-like cAMP-binding protein
MLTVEAFRAALAYGAALHEVIGRMRSTCSSSGCNQRLAMRCMTCSSVVRRRLLQTHDRVDRRDFTLSREFLAMMLGGSRPTVTVVAGTLQQPELIRYTHGRVTINDPNKLEAASCE